MKRETLYFICECGFIDRRIAINTVIHPKDERRGVEADQWERNYCK